MSPTQNTATNAERQPGQPDNQAIDRCNVSQCTTQFQTQEELQEHMATKYKKPRDQTRTIPSSGGRARPNPAATVAWQASTIMSLKSPDRGGPTDSSTEKKPNIQDVQNSTSNLVISSPGPDQSQIKRENFPPSKLEHRATPSGNPKRSRGKAGVLASAHTAFGRRKDPDFDRSLPPVLQPPEDGGNRTSKRLFNPDRDDAKTFNPQMTPVVDPGPRLFDESTLHRRKESRKHPGASEQRPISIVQRNDAAGEPRAKDKDFPQPSVAVLAPHESEERLRMVRQPETRPISPEQLIAEVKGIYAGLIMVEAKCCEVDAKQHQAALEMDGRQPTLNNEQWQALIALHRTLLHEHHDFFLASQHPSASPSLKRLAHKYAMPARMWRHGIHSFLELLRHRLPHSLEHMLTFIYLAYSMMALLYETVPAFEDTWIECLGDLGRYRMAIEDDDVRDREVWQNVARFWYSKAADKTPYVGRLYHHLAILARPNILQQLFYYCKSLGVSQPFTSARESILTVFDPIFNPDVFAARSQPVDASFIQLHSITFTHIEFEKFDVAIDAFLDLLDKHISRPRLEWKVQGFYMAVCNITALYQYGARDSLLRKAWKEGHKSDPSGDKELEEIPPVASIAEEITGESAIDTLLPPYGSGQVDAAVPEEKDEIELPESAATQSIQEISLNASKRLAFTILSLTLERVGDNNVMPHCHAWMVFLSHIINSVPAVRLIENEFPWRSLIEMLNELRVSYDDDGDGDDDKIMSKAFPVPDKGVGRPLPEDYNLRGFDWAKRYFPARWFEDGQIDNEERTQELPSMTNIRRERILWLAMRVCAADDWIKYDSESKTFSMHPTLEHRILESKRKAAAAAVKRESSNKFMADDESDVEMTAAGYSNSEEEDYIMVVPENVRKLKEKKRQLEAQLQAAGPVVTPETIAEVSRSALVKGPEALHQEFTAFVVDTNLLVSHLETFSLIASKGWSVIIPNSVITELHGLGNNSGSVGDSAKSAMIAINKVIAERKDVKIITAKNSDVTKAGFFREKLERDEDDETRNIDDIIIRTTRYQSETRRQSFKERGIIELNGAEPAILLTEDTNMRVKANARGVPAISTTVLKRYLVQLGSRSKVSSTRSKRKSAIVTRIKSEEDEIDTPMFDLPMLMNDTVESKPKIHLGKRRAHKRGKTEMDGLAYTGAK